MRKITNSYQDCTLLNLAYGPNGRGPFVIRQEGYPPESETFKEDRYLLRKDGTWVLNLAVFALPEKEKEQFFYEDTKEVIALLQSLTGDTKVESELPAGKNLGELERAAKDTLTGLWGRIRAAKASSIEL